MQVNPKILKQKFEKSMPKYNENASVQREMAELLVNNLIKNAGQTFAQILELGSGTGLLTEIIADKLFYEHLTCNDIVEKSKFYLDKIVRNYTFIAGNSMKIKPSAHFDLIISNAMFQWFSSLPAALEYYSRMLNKNGVIAFSTFSSGNFNEIRSALGLSLDYLSVDGIKEALKKSPAVIKALITERQRNLFRNTKYCADFFSLFFLGKETICHRAYAKVAGINFAKRRAI